MNQKPANPKDASAIILIKDDKVLWAQRNPQLKFLGGWHAFPGGKTESSDAEISVKNCEDKDLGKFIVSAVRELFEEVGVLIVRNGEKLTRGQRASLHDDLISGRSSFKEILDHWNLWIDAQDFFYTGFWTTPQFSPVRFKTRFFIANCPEKQMPYAATAEMQTPEFVKPNDALNRWKNSGVLISPPVLIALQVLAESEPHGRREDTEIFEERIKSEKADFSLSAALRLCSEKLLEKSQKCDGVIDYIDFNPRITVFPLRTETLPPATHTNCFIVGKREFVVIDAASKDETELAKLFELIDSMIESGAVCRTVIVSHLHPDHFGGETLLQKHLQTKFGLKIPLSAHKITAESLRGKVEFQEFIEDGQIFGVKDEADEIFELKALHTPGHARGHLAFYDFELGFLLSSDNVISTGSVVIAPPEGNLIDYLASLERMENLPDLRFLCGSHGTAIFNGKAKIEEYIAHRLERENQILEALRSGAQTTSEIVAKVYAGVDEKLTELAGRSVEAHLEKLRADGRI